jgi:hypothetical protein
MPDQLSHDRSSHTPFVAEIADSEKTIYVLAGSGRLSKRHPGIYFSICALWAAYVDYFQISDTISQLTCAAFSSVILPPLRIVLTTIFGECVVPFTLIVPNVIVHHGRKSISVFSNVVWSYKTHNLGKALSES